MRYKCTPTEINGSALSVDGSEGHDGVHLHKWVCTVLEMLCKSQSELLEYSKAI